MQSLSQDVTVLDCLVAKSAPVGFSGGVGSRWSQKSFRSNQLETPLKRGNYYSDFLKMKKVLSSCLVKFAKTTKGENLHD